MSYKQKFLRGERVHIASDLGPTMKHFRSGVDAIIDYSYSDCYGGHNTKSYCLLVLGEHPSRSAWYYEHQLTKVKGTRLAGEKLLQRYKNR